MQNNVKTPYNLSKEEADLLSQIAIPAVIQDPTLPNPCLLNYYKDLVERRIWIDSDIDCGVIDVVKQIILFNKEDEQNNIPVEERKPIKVLIYSYGGDGMSALALIDAMLASKTPIYTYNMGVAMSAGLLILLAGSKRYCTKRSTALIHSGSGGTSGSYEQTESQMKDYKHFVETTREVIKDRTNIDQNF